uniref:Uncharacterized protein n=1 Tax=Noccaea caerulescens TaxID=107243 RepID=A0A1J3FTR8_NOCCA
MRSKRRIQKQQGNGWINSLHISGLWLMSHDNGGLRYGLMEIDTKALFAVLRGFLYHRAALSGVVVLMFDELRDAVGESFTRSRDSLSRGDAFTKPVMDKLEEFMKDYDAYVMTPLENDAFEEHWIVQLRQVPMYARSSCLR